MTPTIQQAQIAPVRITSSYTQAIIVPGQTGPVPIQGQIPAQAITVVNPGVIVAGLPQLPVHNPIFTAQPSMLRKRDSPQQVFSNSQKKLKKDSEKSEADDCPQIATMMFMNEFNVDAY